MSQTFYHITPNTNIPKILIEGLKPFREKVLGVEEEETHGKIFLAKQKWLVMDQPMISPTYIPEWAILKLTLPDDWPLHFDKDSLTHYTRQKIPPRYITILERNITGLKPLPRS